MIDVSDDARRRSTRREGPPEERDLETRSRRPRRGRAVDGRDPRSAPTPLAPRNAPRAVRSGGSAAGASEERASRRPVASRRVSLLQRASRCEFAHQQSTARVRRRPRARCRARARPRGPSRRARDSPASSSAPEDAPPDAIAARCLERKTRARVVLHADVRGLTFVDDASLLVLSHSAFNEMTSWSSPRPDAFAVKCFGADGKLAERAFEVLGPRGVDGGVVRDFLESMVRLYVSRPTLVREMRSRAVAMTIGVTAPTRALEIAGVFDDDDDGGGGGRELEALEAGMRGVRFESSSATAAAAERARGRVPDPGRRVAVSRVVSRRPLRRRRRPGRGVRRRAEARDVPTTRVGARGALVEELDASRVRSIHWFPYDRVRVVNADP